MIARLNYLLCCVLPLTTLLFLSHGPYQSGQAVFWLIPFFLILGLDWLNPKFNIPEDSDVGHWFYNALLYTLSTIQFINIALMLNFVSNLEWQTANMVASNIFNLVVLRFLVATSSGTSAIVVAHELMHRPQWLMQQLGRLLLCTVCYEHFDIAHKRGHHLTLGMPTDIATAQFGESFRDYWRRIYVGYLHYAWQSERERLQGYPTIQAILHNQVLQGMTFELLLLVVIFSQFGWLATFMFVYQSVAAVKILEAVNYFQHWGLSDGRFGHTYGWVSNSWLSKYLLIGLSNHIGHHLDEKKRFYEIAYSDKGPKLPYGYLVMNLWIKLNNTSYQKMALRELQRYSGRA